ncbi:RNA polymerase sigma factor FliA [Streptomyces alboniger]
MPQHTSGSDRAAVPPAARARVRPPAPSSLDELWRSYKETGDGRLREQLILHYSPLVKYVAGRVSVGLPPNVEQADFVSSGVFGLIDAIEKFDVERSIKFETYAITRIRGAMIDELRRARLDPALRAPEGAQRRACLRHPGGPAPADPSESEVAAEMGVAVEELHAVFSQLSLANVVALEELLHVGGEGGDRLTLMDTLEDTRRTIRSRSRRAGSCAGCSRGRSTRCRSVRRPSSRSTTTRASRWPRSATSSA